MPNTPNIKGPTNGGIGILYSYIFTAVDPENDNVSYIIDWGDGNNDTTDFYQPGIDVIVNHTWNKKGIFIIKAKAKIQMV